MNMKTPSSCCHHSRSTYYASDAWTYFHTYLGRLHLPFLIVVFEIYWFQNQSDHWTCPLTLWCSLWPAGSSWLWNLGIQLYSEAFHPITAILPVRLLLCFSKVTFSCSYDIGIINSSRLLYSQSSSGLLSSLWLSSLLSLLQPSPVIDFMMMMPLKIKMNGPAVETTDFSILKIGFRLAKTGTFWG